MEQLAIVEKFVQAILVDSAFLQDFAKKPSRRPSRFEQVSCCLAERMILSGKDAQAALARSLSLSFFIFCSLSSSLSSSSSSYHHSYSYSLSLFYSLSLSLFLSLSLSVALALALALSFLLLILICFFLWVLPFGLSSLCGFPETSGLVLRLFSCGAVFPQLRSMVSTISLMSRQRLDCKVACSKKHGMILREGESPTSVLRCY